MGTDEIPVGRAKDMRGQRFGRLTVLYRVKQPEHLKDTSQMAYWKCKCDCGTEIIVRGASLRNGHTQSCGCLQKERTANKNTKPLLFGERYGKLTVIKRKGTDKNGHATYLCQCDCGNTIIVGRDKLITRNTKSCGCIKSFGEQKIQQLLEFSKIPFHKEKTFKDCYGEGNCFKFDFYVNNTYLIEYDGIQHFKPTFGEESFQITKRGDYIKNEYCKANNIPLIRIPYWHYDKITIDDLHPETSQFLV